MTVIHAQRTGNKEFIDKLKENYHFWASPGKYLEHETLVNLIHNISPFDGLPFSLYGGTTFFENYSSEVPADDAMLLTYDLKAAYAESAKRYIDDGDEDGTEEEGDEADWSE